MASEQALTYISVPTATDLSGAQYKAVTIVSGNLVAATAAKNCDGIQVSGNASGDTQTVAISGICKVLLGTGGASANGLLEIASGGTLVAIASGTAVAKALETGAAGAVISAMILKSNAAFV